METEEGEQTIIVKIHNNLFNEDIQETSRLTLKWTTP
jgi:hypothetical protein